MDIITNSQHNVISMASHEPHSGYAPLSIIEAYWDALRAGRDMPKRAEIDPRGIENALENAFILERVAPGVARMRVAGSHLHDIMNMEPRGMPLTSFFQQDFRIRIAGLMEEVFQTPATADVKMKSTNDQDDTSRDARMILLPLKSDLGDVSRILGGIVCRGPLAVATHRFEITDINLRQLDGMSAPMPQTAPTREMHMDGFAEPQSQFMASAPTSADDQVMDGKNIRPSYLRLVKSD